MEKRIENIKKVLNNIELQQANMGYGRDKEGKPKMMHVKRRQRGFDGSHISNLDLRIRANKLRNKIAELEIEDVGSKD